MTAILPHVARGPEGATPVVLIHGFAGSRATWLGQQVALANRRRTIAFDLPGHGAALDWPEIGHAGVAARAVAASLGALGIERFHLVGHSMGGATATLVALRLAEAERVASLTLLAPGGFGPEINHRLLRRFAAAVDRHEILALLEQFYGDGHAVSPELARLAAEERRDPRVTAALVRIVEQILDGERQKAFDPEAIAALPHPVRILWGEQDRVLPARQVRGLPGVVGVHLFAGVGHMPHHEVPREVTRLIAEATAGG